MSAPTKAPRRFADEGGRPAPAGNLRRQRRPVRAVAPVVVEGAVALLPAAGGKFNVGEVAVEGAGPLPAQHLLHPVQHPGKGLRAVVRPQRAGIEMTEVDTGHQPPVQSAQLQHLLQIAQLVDLPHGLGAQSDVPQAGRVDDGQQGGHPPPGNVQRLPAGAAHQRPGVDHHPVRPHPLGQGAGGQHIAVVFLNALRVGQVDEVGGVEGQGNPRRPGVLPDPDRGLLPHVDPLAALVLVAVQTKVRNPPGRGQRGPVYPGKALRVARRAESRAHRKGLLLPSARKGVSMA